MPHSEVEVLTISQEIIREEFVAYLRNVVGRRGKTPVHLTDSLERRVSVFARENGGYPEFTCVYDYQDVELLELILGRLRNNADWMAYNKRHASTLTSGLQHYIKFLQYRNTQEVPPITSPDTYTEGRVSYVHAVGYERNTEARNACIQHYGCRCAICGFDFEKIYGEIGRGFIEVHHVVPIHERGGEYTVNPITDLIPLCSNCHSMIHRRNPVYSTKELTDIIKI